MKNNNVFIFPLLLFMMNVTSYSIIAQTSTEVPPDIINYRILDNSYVAWEAAKITGKHKGKVRAQSGKLIFQDSTLTEGHLILDMSTITCTDLEDEEQNEKLVSHLKSADFFGVEKHPTSEFVIKEAIYYGRDATTNAHKYKLKGDITIKGITKPVTAVTSIYLQHKSQLSAVAPLTIDRSDFDIRYGSGSFFDNLGDKVIQDEIKLYVSLVAAI